MESKSTWPNSWSQNGETLSQVTSNSPDTLSAGASSNTIKEIWFKNILWTIAQRFLFLCLNWSQVHEWVKFTNFCHWYTFKSIISANFIQWVFDVGANWNNCALAVNLIYSIGETVQLSNVFSIQARKSGRSKSHTITFSISRHEYICMLTTEKNLELLENFFKIISSSWQLTESVIWIRCPEETTFSASLVSTIVCTNGNKVVTLNT